MSRHLVISLFLALVSACGSETDPGGSGSGGGGGSSEDAVASGTPSAASGAGGVPAVGASVNASAQSGGTMSHPLCTEYATTYCNCFAELLGESMATCVSDMESGCEYAYTMCASSGKTPEQEIHCSIDTMNSTACDTAALASACKDVPSCS